MFTGTWGSTRGGRMVGSPMSKCLLDRPRHAVLYILWGNQDGFLGSWNGCQEATVSSFLEGPLQWLCINIQREITYSREWNTRGVWSVCSFSRYVSHRVKWPSTAWQDDESFLTSISRLHTVNSIYYYLLSAYTMSQLLISIWHTSSHLILPITIWDKNCCLLKYTSEMRRLRLGEV